MSLALSLATTFAQVKIGTDHSAAHVSAMLEIESSNRGFLPPRVALTSNTMKLNSTTTNPPDGMIVYNTSVSLTNGLPSTGLYIWRDSQWNVMIDEGTDGFSVGDVKPFFTYLGLSMPAGWVECNGQTLNDSSSPLNGKTLPNLNNNTYLVGVPSASNGSTMGSNTVKLTQANLPNVTLSGTTNSISAGTPSGTVTVASGGGAHTHTLTDAYFTQDTNTWSGGGSASGGYVGYTASKTSTTASGGAHTHTATFSGDVLASHNHTASIALNGNVTQTNVSIQPQSVGVTWIMKVK